MGEECQEQSLRSAGLRRDVKSKTHISWRMTSSPASQVEESRGDATAQTRSGICQHFCPCHIDHDKQQCTHCSVPRAGPERGHGVGCAGLA